MYASSTKLMTKQPSNIIMILSDALYLEANSFVTTEQSPTKFSLIFTVFNGYNHHRCCLHSFDFDNKVSVYNYVTRSP